MIFDEAAINLRQRRYFVRIVEMGNMKEEALLSHAFRSESLLSPNIVWMLDEASIRVCEYPSMISLMADLGFSVTLCSNPPATAEDPTAESDPSSDLPFDHE